MVDSETVRSKDSDESGRASAEDTHQHASGLVAPPTHLVHCSIYFISDVIVCRFFRFFFFNSFGSWGRVPSATFYKAPLSGLRLVAVVVWFIAIQKFLWSKLLGYTTYYDISLIRVVGSTVRERERERERERVCVCVCVFERERGNLMVTSFYMCM